MTYRNMSAKRLHFLIFAILLHSFASCDPVTLITPHNPDCSCPSELIFCKLEADKLSFTNIVGEPGSVGEHGLKGEKGRPGLDGTPGSNGPAGFNGTDGKNGDLGLSGPKGEMGPQGPPGLEGATGIQGLASVEPGQKGEPGPPGESGTCVCDDSEREFTPRVEDNWGTKDYPGAVTCRNAPIDKTGEYYLYKGIKVTCYNETKKTCVSHASDTNVTYTEEKPFWLSQKNVTLKDIYNLESDQLTWLQRESYTTSLTIRYHCMNSVPTGKNAMILLSWNDLKIGPEPTSTSPFHYHILSEGCSVAENNTWNYTDIKLVSAIAQRLPIIDFKINDVRNTSQALRIEIMELCFG